MTARMMIFASGTKPALLPFMVGRLSITNCANPERILWRGQGGCAAEALKLKRHNPQQNSPGNPKLSDG